MPFGTAARPLWGFIATIFFRWYAKEEREEAAGLPWRGAAEIPVEVR